jgi:hypothetical protein
MIPIHTRQPIADDDIISIARAARNLCRKRAADVIIKGSRCGARLFTGTAIRKYGYVTVNVIAYSEQGERIVPVQVTAESILIGSKSIQL